MTTREKARKAAKHGGMAISWAVWVLIALAALAAFF